MQGAYLLPGSVEGEPLNTGALSEKHAFVCSLCPPIEHCRSQIPA